MENIPRKQGWRDQFMHCNIYIIISICSVIAAFCLKDNWHKGSLFSVIWLVKPFSLGNDHTFILF